jgi:hypothetical protein
MGKIGVTTVTFILISSRPAHAVDHASAGLESLKTDPGLLGHLLQAKQVHQWSKSSRVVPE